MATEPMTLIEKLRNPAWQSAASMNGPAILHVEQTRDTMQEAAEAIERLTAEPFKKQELYVAVVRVAAHRANLMPTEYDALRIMFEARQRLMDLGWREGLYAPRDGTIFETIEHGSTGIHDCYFSGEWPDGYWNYIDHDVYPSRSPPVLYRLKPKTSQ